MSICTSMLCPCLAPSQCSADMRHFIQALLVAYAEPRLNTTEPATAIRATASGASLAWYQHLVHPRRRASQAMI